MSRIEEFQDEKVDLLLKHLTRPCKELSGSFITSPPETFRRRCSLEGLFRKIPPSIPTAGLGALDKLPIELLLMVLRYMDIGSLLNLRQVNRFSRDLIHTLRHWRLLISSREVVKAIQALILYDIASFFTIEDLYHALLTQTCIECGTTAPRLFLPKLARCCYRCLGSSHKLSLLRFPGTRYSAGHLEKIRKHGLLVFASPLGKRNLMVKEDVLNMDIPGIGRGTQQKWRSRSTDIQATRHATITFPYLSQEDKKIRLFLNCRGCYIGERSALVTKEGYMEHFRRCNPAKAIWHERQMALNRVDKLWEGLQKLWEEGQNMRKWVQNLWGKI